MVVESGQTAGAGPTVAASGGVLRARLAAAGAGTGGQPPLPPPPPPSLERGVASAITRAAQRIHGLHVKAETISASGISLAELPELLPEGALLAIIEGPGERLGVVALCPAIIASLIEMQAMGRISARSAPARRATRTDAAIAADFVNLLIEELIGTLGPLPMGAALADLRYASYLDDPRPLGLMLDDGGFHGLAATLRLGPGGERRGTMLVAIPGAGAGACVHIVRPEGVEARPPVAEPATTPVRTTLAATVRLAPVPLVAVLCRRTLSLREVRGLLPGTVLTLPKNALNDVLIETASCQKVAQGRLGEADGLFAVRLQGEGGAAAGPAVLPQFAAGTGPTRGETDAHAWPEPPIDDLGSPDLFREASHGAEMFALPLLTVPGG